VDEKGMTMKTTLWKTLAGMLLALTLSSLAHADANQVRARLKEKVPRLSSQVVSVAPAHILGLYEIYTEDRQVMYTDENVTYVFVGDILEAKGLKNITEARAKVLGAISLDSMPLNMALKRVKGDGHRRLVVFSDVDCPYCRRLENELKSVDNVTIYTFIYPIAALHDKATERSRQIWCSADPARAWDDYMSHSTLPPADAKSQCDLKALETAQELGRKYHFNGTPTIIFANGEVVGGLIPAKEIETRLGAR
jgi:thiol:disulfide interchange protein DsbC